MERGSGEAKRSPYIDPKEEGFPKRSARSAKIAAISLWIGSSESVPDDLWSSAVGREDITAR
jgi:hypothetical protein